MGNLYVWVDDRNRDRVARTVGDLARRHRQFREFLSEGDGIEDVLNLLFPHGMPMEYHAANLSIENRPDDNLNLALRPVMNPEQPWPFPRGCSLAVRGFWPTRVPSPVFMVQDLFEVADAPGHSYERSLTVVVYQDNPQLPRIQRNNNALTRELAHELPPISITTREKLTDWSDFLKWKRKIVSEKTRGLRFIQREWQEDRIVFQVIGESEQYLRDVHRSLSRQDVMAFDLNVSVDVWTFRIDDRDSAKRAPRGFELGQPEAMTKLAPHADKIKDCEWATPYFAEVAVGLSEDDQNQLTVAEDVPTTQRMLLSRIPEQGFLSVSAAGDLALIRRHEMAIKRLQDQGGYRHVVRWDRVGCVSGVDSRTWRELAAAATQPAAPAVGDEYDMGALPPSNQPKQDSSALEVTPQDFLAVVSRLMKQSGQDQAVQAVNQILVRAYTGLSGLQHSSKQRTPKGVLFFVGPTGVGKTELAKALAHFLFGDDEACLRFDMSEFNHEHADQRLVGAPPGYVGYEEGGQLTNAVKKRPFSLLLFDEIEKAHPRILDKFLQILEDGRLTDGKGDTVLFSDTVIVFTSNIGAGQIEVNNPDVRTAFIEMVRSHFVSELKRPELLGRIGEGNIIPFNFMSDDNFLVEIARSKLEPLRHRLGEKWGTAALQFSDETKALQSIVSMVDRTSGGRGVLNALTIYLFDPLAQFLFDQVGSPEKAQGRAIRVVQPGTKEGLNNSQTHAV